MRRLIAAASAVLLWSGVAHAQGYAGNFTTANAAGQPVTLVLQQDAQGNVTGTIATGQLQAQVNGQPEGEAVVGIIAGQGEAMYFQAQFEGSELVLILVPADAQGNPSYDAAQELRFTRGGQPAAAAGGNPPAQPGEPQGQGAAAAEGAGGGLSDGTPLGNEWAAFVAGKKFTQMDSYSSGSTGGYSMRIDVYLCSSGEFLYRDQSSVSVDVGGAFGYSGGNESNTGRWRIVTEGQVAGIELRYNDGRVEQYRLDHVDGKTYVNGQRFFVTPAEICP